MNRVEFISYDGAYPNLCSGILVLRIDGEEVVFPQFRLRSGGRTWFDADGNERVSRGRWEVDIPAGLEYLKEEIEDCVNENIPWGCCGGCI